MTAENSQYLTPLFVFVTAELPDGDMRFSMLLDEDIRFAGDLTGPEASW